MNGTYASFSVTGEVGAGPTDSTAAQLQLELGTVEGGTCVTVVSATMAKVVRSDGSFAFSGAMGWSPGSQDVCGAMSVLSADGSTVLDRMVEELGAHTTSSYGPGPIEGFGGQLQINDVRDLTVTPRHWEDVWVQVSSSGCCGTSFIVSGHGRRLKVKPVRGKTPSSGPEKVWVPLRVKLRKDHSTLLTVTVQSTGPYAEDWQPTRKTVELRPDRRGDG